MPKLWDETIEGHRREVRGAILDTTAALAAKHGLLSVTMSQIAEETGIGRATLYKYFSDVKAILIAWHDREVASHLEHLAKLRSQNGDAGERLEAVLETYALIIFEHHTSDLAALVHDNEHNAQAHRQLNDLVQKLLTEAATAGDIRDDVAPGELANYCLHAISAVRRLSSKAAVRRLVQVILGGLQTKSS